MLLYKSYSYTGTQVFSRIFTEEWKSQLQDILPSTLYFQSGCMNLLSHSCCCEHPCQPWYYTFLPIIWMCNGFLHVILLIICFPLTTNEVEYPSVFVGHMEFPLWSDCSSVLSIFLLLLPFSYWFVKILNIF